MLNHMLGSLGCPNQMMQIKDGNLIFGETGTDASDLQFRVIDEERMYGIGVPILGCKPGLDDKQPFKLEVTGHAANGKAKSLERSDVTD